MKPAFGYYGAKVRIASQIINSLPPHNAWVEAFCGSAALTLAKKPAPIVAAKGMTRMRGFVSIVEQDCNIRLTRRMQRRVNHREHP